MSHRDTHHEVAHSEVLPKDLPAEDADALLAFLPLFGQREGEHQEGGQRGRDFIRRWHGGKQPDGSLQWPWPQYEEDAARFLTLLGAWDWESVGTSPERAQRLVEDEDAIRDADLRGVLAGLFYCVRGEHFSDGHFGAMLRSGTVGTLLSRLRELRGGPEDASDIHAEMRASTKHFGGNLTRSLAAATAFRAKYGAWPTELHLRLDAMGTLPHHLTPLGLSLLQAKMLLVVSPDSRDSLVWVRDGGGRTMDLSNERDREWLGRDGNALLGAYWLGLWRHRVPAF